MRQWAFTETLSKKLFHFYLEWCEHDPHRALRLVLDILVASTTKNPSPETGRVIKEHVLKTLVEIVARKSATQLTKSGLMSLDHFLSKRAITLEEVARKYKEIQPSVADLPSISVWRAFAFELFSWMELTYLCPLVGKSLVHVFKGLNSVDSANSPELGGFTIDIWYKWLLDAVAQNPGCLEDLKNYVLVPIFNTDKAASLRILESFNRTTPEEGSNQELTDHALLLQLATLETGKRFGLVEEPSKLTNLSFTSEDKTNLLDRRCRG